MSRILYGIINKKAEKLYMGPEISAKNYDVWIKHWFSCAEEVAIEFDDNGLSNTAKAVRDIIDDKKLCRSYFNET